MKGSWIKTNLKEKILPSVKAQVPRVAVAEYYRLSGFVPSNRKGFSKGIKNCPKLKRT